MPPHPEPQLLTGLAQVLAGLRDELIASPDPGSALFTLERLGHDVPRPADLAWAEALGTACGRAEVPLPGVFLSTGSGVQRLR
ncbi:hypothetical protein ACVGVM_06665 [Pseudonocardia bannensis]|uniref:Uncharacterized protein n=1 Tax=Pseudonocardia bannensis TaxID=630973 RepID=A0A848DGX2_9PSEU|nr:hypothetical protein [Pseudonocardia bannensis]NMH91783.1 hypothetical protein [Pseudonocardia bannensis]